MERKPKHRLEFSCEESEDMIKAKQHAYMGIVYQAIIDSFFETVKPDAELAERISFYANVVRPAFEDIGTAFFNMSERNAPAEGYNATHMAALAVYAQVVLWVFDELPVDSYEQRENVMEKINERLIFA